MLIFGQNMEGNLTRARSTLYINSSDSLSSIHSSSPLSRSTPSPPENKRIVSQMRVPPTKHRQIHTSSDTPNASPGHSRVYSENSIAEDLRNVPFLVRSASAAARYGGRNGMDANQPSPQLSGSRDNFREDAKSLGASSFNKPSPPKNLKPLNEDEVVPEFSGDNPSVRLSIDEEFLSGIGEPRGLARSTSSMQMRDLKDQMYDLKGRLSVLRDRARDDTMKRRSLQSLRTPSPFTAAEQWYTAAQAYKAPGLSADAGVGHSPRKEGTFEEDENTFDEAGPIHHEDSKRISYADSEVTSVYEDVSESHDTTDLPHSTHIPQIPEKDESYGTAAEDDQEGQYGDEDYIDEIVHHEELDDYESDTSLYHDTQTISHEDREDAFDYEHFFLHSAMGTISQRKDGRRDSFSSEDSAETTRGPTTLDSRGANRASLGHLRSESTDSVSTMVTFVTATEGLGSEDFDGEDQDNYAVQHINAPDVRSDSPSTSKRLTFGVGISEERMLRPEHGPRRKTATHDPEERNGSSIHRPSVASFDSLSSTGTTRSFPLINKPKSQPSSPTPNGTSDSSLSRQNSTYSATTTTLTDGQNVPQRLQPSPVGMLPQDDQLLVERVVASLGKCVLGLQESSRGSYEGRLWRSRLEAARRTLEGEEGPI